MSEVNYVKDLLVKVFSREDILVRNPPMAEVIDDRVLLYSVLYTVSLLFNV